MSLLALRLQESHGSYPSGLDTQELREQNYGLIMKARESNLLNAINVQTIQNGWGVPTLKVPVLGQSTPTYVDGAMDCSFTTADVDGALVTVTFIQGSFPIELAYREASSLQLTREQIFARAFRNAELGVYDKIEDAIYTALDNAKSTTYNSGYVGVGKKFTLAADTLQVAAADKQMFFNYAKSIMASDNFPQSGLQVIGNTGLAALVNEFGNQGGANSTNSQFQFNGYNFGYSNNVVNTAAVSSEATGFIMPSDSIAMISQVSPEAQTMQKADNKEWMTFRSDLLGLDLEVMREVTCADVSAKTGNALDIGGKLERWKLGYKIAILTPYNTGTNGGIKKFDMLP